MSQCRFLHSRWSDPSCVVNASGLNTSDRCVPFLLVRSKSQSNRDAFSSVKSCNGSIGPLAPSVVMSCSRRSDLLMTSQRTFRVLIGRKPSDPSVTVLRSHWTDFGSDGQIRAPVRNSGRSDATDGGQHEQHDNAHNSTGNTHTHRIATVMVSCGTHTYTHLWTDVVCVCGL